MTMLIAHASPIEHSLLVAALCLAVVVYGLGWLRTRGRPTGRLLSWIGGILALAVATSPPIESLADETFTGHMVQHLLLIVVAAPLIVIAQPIRTVAPLWAGGHRAAGTAAERRVARWWHLAGPMIAPLVFVVVLFVTHLTGIYDRALNDQFVHDGEHLAYLLSSIALWSVIRAAGRASAVSRIGAVFAVIAGSALLGVVLMTATAPLVPTYAAELGTSDALSDQRVAAALMWVGGMGTTLPLLIVAFWRWASTEERITQRSEELAARHRVGI